MRNIRPIYILVLILEKSITMIFPTVSNVSGYNILFALLSTAAVLRIQPSVERTLPAVIEASTAFNISTELSGILYYIIINV